MRGGVVVVVGSGSSNIREGGGTLPRIQVCDERRGRISNGERH